MDFCKITWLDYKIRLAGNIVDVFGFCSVSAPSATIYAYVGEFHSNNYRSKVMMLGEEQTIIIRQLCNIYSFIFKLQQCMLHHVFGIPFLRQLQLIKSGLSISQPWILYLNHGDFS